MSVQTEKSIHEAVRSSDLKALEEILQRDPSCINDWNLNFQSPLHLIYDDVDDTITQADHKLPMMQLLINYGADLNARGGLYLHSALHFAVEKQQIKGVKLLLENNADPNIRDNYNYTALHRAAGQNSKNIIEMLLEYKADINALNHEVGTPLDTAIISCRIDSVKKLIALKAKSQKIFEVLLQACCKISKLTQEEEDIDNTREKSQRDDYASFIEYVLGHATEIDFYDKFSVKALFYYALSKNHEKDHLEYDKCLLFELLKKHGTDVINVRSITGDSELHLAVRDADDTKVEVLLRKGANVNETNFFGETPMHLVLKLIESCDSVDQHERIASLLIDHETDWWAHNYFDETPFLLATKLRNVRLVNFLLTKITKINEDTLIGSYKQALCTVPIVLKEDESKLHELIVAITLHHEEMVDRLLDMDRIIESCKNNCQNISRALYTATRTYQFNIVKILLEAGFRADGSFNDIVPCFLRVEYEEGYLQITSLFWEFKDCVIIDRAIIYALSGVVYYAIVNKFTSLIVFYYAIYLQLREFNAHLMPAKGLFKLHKELSRILSDCRKKLNELKTIKAGDITIYDVITMPQNSLVKLFNNTNLVDACMNYCSSLKDREELEYYEHAVKTRIDLAVEKRQLLDSAKDSFNNAFRPILEAVGFKSLPDQIVWNIFVYLNVRDLRKVAQIN